MLIDHTRLFVNRARSDQELKFNTRTSTDPTGPRSTKLEERSLLNALVMKNAVMIVEQLEFGEALVEVCSISEQLAKIR